MPLPVRQRALDLIARTELNALVIDIEDEPLARLHPEWAVSVSTMPHPSMLYPSGFTLPCAGNAVIQVKAERVLQDGLWWVRTVGVKVSRRLKTGP